MHNTWIDKVYMESKFQKVKIQSKPKLRKTCEHKKRKLKIDQTYQHGTTYH